MFDIHNAYKKLANNEALSNAETQYLLKELEHFRATAAYLANCHAASAEALPRSASNGVKRRHIAVLRAAIDALKHSRITWALAPGSTEKQVEVAAERCERLLLGDDHVQ